MTKRTKIVAIPLILVSAVMIFTACKHWDNFTTYFNAYYNMQRLMKESEEEFDYQSEKERVDPRVFVPANKYYVPAVPEKGPPPFMRDLIISKRKLQPVKIKLDSIEIKGSKILAKHPKSKYIEGTLFLMAKGYFYKADWINSQVKCAELIDKFPDGDLSPDAHLLEAKVYLIQRKFLAGKVLLSRCVDVAWQKERYDILSEAFRYEAEVALFENDHDEALRPYRQAIAQCDDSEVKGRWQVDMAALMYRMGRYEDAMHAFAKARRYSPDYPTEFESLLYEAMCASRIGLFERSQDILEDLEDDGKYDEWKGYTQSGFLVHAMELENDSLYFEEKGKADSLYAGNSAILTTYFERGMNFFAVGDYANARKYFAKSRSRKSPVFHTSERLYNLLNDREKKYTYCMPVLELIDEGKILEDSVASKFTLNLFELGRIEQQLGHNDSAGYYYWQAVLHSPEDDPTSARYLYVYAKYIQETDPVLADSLFELVVEKYTTTEYGRDAMKIQGYTDNFVIDTVRELYRSGFRLKKTHEYNYAANQWTKVYESYPESGYAPQSLYALGWMFEKDLDRIDTAVHYYQLLLDNYPTSSFAADVKISVEYYYALQSGKEMPAYLKDRAQTEYIRKPIILKDSILYDEKTFKKKKKEDDFDPFDIFSDPSKVIDGVKDMISEPIRSAGDQIKNVTDIDKLKQNLDPALELPSFEGNLELDSGKTLPIQPLPQDTTKKK
jgi:tetratricopeptide (TPR) repeat protein